MNISIHLRQRIHMRRLFYPHPSKDFPKPVYHLISCLMVVIHVAEYDVLRDEAIAYSEALQAAG
jgi:acetyl esterase/lipase